MERKTKSKTETTGPVKPRWRKITRGTLYPFPNQRNRRVKPNEVISATEAEIEKYRDQFELVSDGTGSLKVKTTDAPKAKKEKLAKKPEKESHELVPIGEGLYNVMSPAGKQMNEEGLKLEEAQALKVSLDKETVEAE